MFGNDDDDSKTTDTTGTFGMTPSIDAVADDLNNDVTTPVPIDQSVQTDTSALGSVTTSQDSTDSGQSTNQLIDIKSQALKQLTPLVDHLEQSPEEKFRTTMMMIQASDNQDLIQDAYNAAQQITDEKAKAQALLDVVNEINYFTQHD